MALLSVLPRSGLPCLGDSHFSHRAISDFQVLYASPPTAELFTAVVLATPNQFLDKRFHGPNFFCARFQ